jgi:hypothetical protein
MLAGTIEKFVDAGFGMTPFARTETFESESGVGRSPARAAIVSLITVLIVFSIILFVGKYLWNNVLHELVPAIKPAKSIFQILGLAILISLMSPGCSCGY